MSDYNYFPFFYELKEDRSVYNNEDNIDSILHLVNENEWTQEYQLIYKSYTLEYNLEYKEQKIGL